MGIRSLLKRIEKVEAALKEQSIFSPDCICFPKEEPPCFCLPFEEPIAAEVKCPLHGERFKRQRFFIFTASWRREQEPERRERLSAQYRKAWEASFPSGLWPAVPQEEIESGRIFLRLKDGARRWVGACPR